MSLYGDAKEFQEEGEIEIIRRNIKKLMDQKNIKSKTALAKYVGLPRDTIMNVMTRKDRRPSKQTLKIIAEAFGVPYQYIVSEESQMGNLDDLAVAKMVMDEGITDSIYKEASASVKFQRAMTENGYDDIAAFVNFFQFLGYQLDFYSEESYEDINKKQDIINRFRSKKKQMEKRLKELYILIEKEEAKLDADSEYPRDNYYMYFGEISDISVSLENMKMVTFEDKVMKHTIRMDESIKMFRKIAGDTEKIKEFSKVFVAITFPDGKTKTVKFNEFYWFCADKVSTITADICAL